MTAIVAPVADAVGTAVLDHVGRHRAVAPYGAALVVTHTMSKSWSDPMIERNAQIRMVGPSSGSVMYHWVCHQLAPSICGGLAELLGHALESGEHEDDREAEVLPGEDAEHRPQDDVGVGEPGWAGRRQPDGLEEGVERRRSARAAASRTRPAMTSAST